MKHFFCLPPLLLMSLPLLGHAGHGLVDGHEWFHALLPFVGAALIVIVRQMGRRVLEKVRRAGLG